VFIVGCTQSVLGNMLNPSIVKSIQQEIRRINGQIRKWRKQVRYCRANISAFPGEPDEDEESVQGLLDEESKWVRARTARVLQLMGNRVKGPILSTFEGQTDYFLSSPSITLKCKKGTK
jgi:hypothetical protein